MVFFIFIFLILEMRRLKPSNVKYLAQGHTASTRQNQVLNLGLPVPEAVFLATTECRGIY